MWKFYEYLKYFLIATLLFATILTESTRTLVG
jgi:hypothetical protein